MDACQSTKKAIKQPNTFLKSLYKKFSIASNIHQTNQVTPSHIISYLISIWHCSYILDQPYINGEGDTIGIREVSGDIQQE